jgi:hypothetical protein
MVGFESDRNLPITGEQQELLICRNLEACEREPKGEPPKWLEMKIPGPHTRSTKAMSSEAHTKRVLKRVGGNSNSKASRRTAPNRIVMSESRTTAAMRRCDWPANRAADGRAPALQVAKARCRTNWSGCQSVWAPCGEPSSLGTSRYPVGCPIVRSPDKRGRGLL